MSKLLRSVVPLLISLFVTAAAMPVMASAAPIPSAVDVRTVDRVVISDLERSMIVSELRQRVIDQRTQPSWKCVDAPIDISPASPGEPALPPLGAYVDITALLVPGSGDNEGGVDVQVAILLAGKQLSAGFASIRGLDRY